MICTWKAPSEKVNGFGRARDNDILGEDSQMASGHSNALWILDVYPAVSNIALVAHLHA